MLKGSITGLHGFDKGLFYKGSTRAAQGFYKDSIKVYCDPKPKTLNP